MSDHREIPTGPRSQRLLVGIGERALRPFSSAAGVAVRTTTIVVERVVVEPILDSPDFERLVSSALNSDRVHAAVERLFESDGARRLVDSFFDSGLFDEFASRLLESDALWELVDRVADSPSVTAAITQQSLGFADQMGEEVRSRSRNADDWLERAARRLSRRRAGGIPPNGEGPEPATP
jgi:hypothetical protein